MIVNEESFVFGQLVGQKKQFEDVALDLGEIVKSNF